MDEMAIQQQTTPPVGEKEAEKMMELLNKYKSGKTVSVDILQDWRVTQTRRRTLRRLGSLRR